MPSSSVSSTDSDTDSPSTSRSWWRWRWRTAPVSVIGEDENKKNDDHLPPPSPAIPLAEGRREEKAPVQEMEMSAWDRIRELYEKPSMERDLVERAARMTFLGGFVYGGASGYVLAKQQYEIANKGRKYLSPSDAIKRRLDFAIVRFAMKGFSMGIKAGFISGSIVLLTTHTATVRRHFSAFYFPAFSGPLAVLLHSETHCPMGSSAEWEDNLGVDGNLTNSALVGGVFAFPLGVIGVAKAFGLGISSGLTLSAVTGLYALSTDRSVDSAYWHLKREYEAELAEEGAFEKRVVEVIHEQKVWRYQAVKIVKEEEENKLKRLDA